MYVVCIFNSLRVTFQHLSVTKINEWFNNHFLTLLQILSLSQVEIAQVSVGHIINLASNDVQRFDPVRSCTKLMHPCINANMHPCILPSPLSHPPPAHHNKWYHQMYFHQQQQNMLLYFKLLLLLAHYNVVHTKLLCNHNTHGRHSLTSHICGWLLCTWSLSHIWCTASLGGASSWHLVFSYYKYLCRLGWLSSLFISGNLMLLLARWFVANAILHHVGDLVIDLSRLGSPTNGFV